MDPKTAQAPSATKLDLDAAAARVHTAFVLGPPRSGTTLIGYLLARGQGVLSVSEPYLARTTLVHWRLRRFFYRMQRHAGMRVRPAPHYGNADRFDLFLRRMAAENDCPYLAIKETYRRNDLQNTWLNEPLLNYLLRENKHFVALIRHPYDLAASTIRLCHWVTGPRSLIFKILSLDFPSFRDTTEVVRWAADNWTAYLNWSRQHGMSLLRYEDFVRDPDKQFPAVCEKLAIPFQKIMLENSPRQAMFGGLGDPGLLLKPPRPVDRNSIGHSKGLTDHQRSIVRDACGHLAPDYDYSL